MKRNEASTVPVEQRFGRQRGPSFDVKDTFFSLSGSLAQVGAEASPSFTRYASSIFGVINKVGEGFTHGGEEGELREVGEHIGGGSPTEGMGGGFASTISGEASVKV